MKQENQQLQQQLKELRLTEMDLDRDPGDLQYELELTKAERTRVLQDIQTLNQN